MFVIHQPGRCMMPASSQQVEPLTIRPSVIVRIRSAPWYLVWPLRCVFGDAGLDHDDVHTPTSPALSPFNRGMVREQGKRRESSSMIASPMPEFGLIVC